MSPQPWERITDAVVLDPYHPQWDRHFAEQTVLDALYRAWVHLGAAAEGLASVAGDADSEDLDDAQACLKLARAELVDYAAPARAPGHGHPALI